ncbi:ubiquitin-related domain-containing protein [Gongronella butleri]|nr:ubiquitin-related domain-containing protein [Gongronella butleri]
MHLTITTHGDDIYNVEVDTQMTLEDLKALLETECGQPPERQILYFNGNQLNEAKKTLEQYEIKDYDMLLLQTSRAMPSSSALGGASDSSHYEVMRQHVLSDPRLMEELARVQPAIAQAARNNPQEFATLMEQVDRTRRQAEQQRQDLLAASDNPFDVDAQKRIEEAIRQENIAANLEAAMEYNPESFARVTRLYVNVEINGTKLVALVDSGAQSTVTPRPPSAVT